MTTISYYNDCYKTDIIKNATESNHRPLIQKTNKCVTLNTTHCFYNIEKLNLLKTEKLDFCENKNENIINMIRNFIEQKNNFILLQEVSLDLLSKINNYLITIKNYKLFESCRPISHLLTARLKADGLDIFNSVLGKNINPINNIPNGICETRDFENYNVTIFNDELFEILDQNPIPNSYKKFIFDGIDGKGRNCRGHTLCTNINNDHYFYRHHFISLKNKETKKNYLIFNVHYSKRARLKSNKFLFDLIIDPIGTLNDGIILSIIENLNKPDYLPIIIIGGDFNKTFYNEYNYLVQFSNLGKNQNKFFKWTIAYWRYLNFIQLYNCKYINTYNDALIISTKYDRQHDLDGVDHIFYFDIQSASQQKKSYLELDPPNLVLNDFIFLRYFLINIYNLTNITQNILEINNLNSFINILYRNIFIILFSEIIIKNIIIIILLLDDLKNKINNISEKKTILSLIKCIYIDIIKNLDKDTLYFNYVINKFSYFTDLKVFITNDKDTIVEDTITKLKEVFISRITITRIQQIPIKYIKNDVEIISVFTNLDIIVENVPTDQHQGLPLGLPLGPLGLPLGTPEKQQDLTQECSDTESESDKKTTYKPKSKGAPIGKLFKPKSRKKKSSAEVKIPKKTTTELIILLTEELKILHHQSTSLEISLISSKSKDLINLLIQELDEIFNTSFNFIEFITNRIPIINFLSNAIMSTTGNEIYNINKVNCIEKIFFQKKIIENIYIKPNTKLIITNEYNLIADNDLHDIFIIIFENLFQTDSYNIIYGSFIAQDFQVLRGDLKINCTNLNTYMILIKDSLISGKFQKISDKFQKISDKFQHYTKMFLDKYTDHKEILNKMIECKTQLIIIRQKEISNLLQLLFSIFIDLIKNKSTLVNYFFNIDTQEIFTFLKVEELIKKKKDYKFLKKLILGFMIFKHYVNYTLLLFKDTILSQLELISKEFSKFNFSPDELAKIELAKSNNDLIQLLFIYIMNDYLQSDFSDESINTILESMKKVLDDSILNSMNDKCYIFNEYVKNVNIFYEELHDTSLVETPLVEIPLVESPIPIDKSSPSELIDKSSPPELISAHVDKGILDKEDYIPTPLEINLINKLDCIPDFSMVKITNEWVRYSNSISVNIDNINYLIFCLGNLKLIHDEIDLNKKQAIKNSIENPNISDLKLIIDDSSNLEIDNFISKHFQLLIDYYRYYSANLITIIYDYKIPNFFNQTMTLPNYKKSKSDENIISYFENAILCLKHHLFPKTRELLDFYSNKINYSTYGYIFNIYNNMLKDYDLKYKIEKGTILTDEETEYIKSNTNLNELCSMKNKYLKYKNKYLKYKNIDN